MSEHFKWLVNSFDVVEADEKSESILFWACGELCCEIHGQPFTCSSREEFYELMKYYKDYTSEDFAL